MTAWQRLPESAKLVISVALALAVSMAWFVAAVAWLSVSDWSTGFMQMMRGEPLSVSPESTWASGYRFQYFVLYGLPPLHGASVAFVQRSLAPTSAEAWAFVPAVPGALVMILSALIVFYAHGVAVAIILGFAGVAAAILAARARHSAPTPP